MSNPNTKVPTFNLPTPPERYDPSWFARTLEVISRAINNKLSTETANTGILKVSPGGKVFLETIDESGNRVMTYIRG